jgi:hypothetical protein
MDIITNLHQRLCGEGSVMTLWTMTDIAGTYRAASHLIPFGTSRGFAYHTVTSSHIFLEGGRRYILQGTVGQRTVRRLSLYLVLDEVVLSIPIAKDIL